MSEEADTAGGRLCQAIGVSVMLPVNPYFPDASAPLCAQLLSFNDKEI